MNRLGLAAGGCRPPLATLDGATTDKLLVLKNGNEYVFGAREAVLKQLESENVANKRTRELLPEEVENGNRIAVTPRVGDPSPSQSNHPGLGHSVRASPPKDPGKSFLVF